MTDRLALGIIGIMVGISLLIMALPTRPTTFGVQVIKGGDYGQCLHMNRDGQYEWGKCCQ